MNYRDITSMLIFSKSNIKKEAKDFEDMLG